MDDKGEVRDFLTRRRARLTPTDAGLPAYGGNRRVPGLRREEVAMLASLSVDYYTKLERRELTGVSERVLTSISRALRLDDAEREHLMDLARRANAGPIPRRRPRETRVRSSIIHAMDAIQDAPPGCATGATTSSLPTSSHARCSCRPSSTPRDRRSRPVHVPRPCRHDFLARLGGGRFGQRSLPARRSGSQSRRQGHLRPGWRNGHAERPVQAMVDET